MNKIILFFTCLIFIACKTQSNKTNQDDSNVKAYMKIVYEQCAKPDITEVESTIDGYIEVKFLCDGKRYEIGIKDNVLLFSEHSVTRDEIPFDEIKAKIDKKHPGWTLDEVSKVTTKDTTFLKVEILREGIEQNLYFTTEGKNFKINLNKSTSTLDFKAIEENNMYKLTKYEFNKPDSIYEMPDLLREVSGIALNGEDIVYCVQDEIGSIFEFDLRKQEISNFYRFTDIGDFEDLAINKNIIYVLRSDGNLFTYDLNNKAKMKQSMLQTNSLNIEGLFFHENHLYLACKEALISQPETKRMVYRVNTDNLEDIEAYMEIDITEMTSFLSNNYPQLGISSFQFNPSAIAIHPITKEIYILSASDRFMAIYNDKNLVNVVPLSEDVYYKPEGLSFYENGDLLISSEGDKKGYTKGSINLIKYN